MFKYCLTKDDYIQNLKNFYSEYLYMIRNLQNHLLYLLEEQIIDNDYYTLKLNILHHLISQMKTISNDDYIKFNECDDLIVSENDIPSIFNNVRNLYVIESLNNSTIDGFYEKNKFNPLLEIKMKIIDIVFEVGYHNLYDLLTFLFYSNNFKNSELDLFHLVLIPLRVKCIKDNDTKELKIFKSSNLENFPFDNTLKIKIKIPSTNNSLVINGILKSDPLNTLVRGSSLLIPYIHKIRLQIHHSLNKSVVPSKFWKKYLENMNYHYYINLNHGIVEMIISDYHYYCDLISENNSSLLKKFIICEMQPMLRILFLLSLGDETECFKASFLLQSLQSLQNGKSAVCKLLFDHAPFSLQKILTRFQYNLEEEKKRINSLMIDDISIEIKLASNKNIPDNVKSYIMTKYKEIKSQDNISKNQLAINGLLQFPWKPKDAKTVYHELSSDNQKSCEYLEKLHQTLDKNVYGHTDAKNTILELVARWIKNPDSGGKIIGLCGPPGVGKTLFSKSLGKALGIPVVKIDLGGMSDPSELVGHSFSYSSSTYGMIISKLISAGSWRCVLHLDELGKTGKKQGTEHSLVNAIHDTLIHLTDLEANKHFQDHFYGGSIEFDLSGLLIVATYNSDEYFNTAFSERIEEIKISPYSMDDKNIITKNFLLPNAEDLIKVNHDQIHIDHEFIKYLVVNYTNEGGVRILNRLLMKIFEKINYKYMIKNLPIEELFLTEKHIHMLLGESQMETEKIHGDHAIGIINGVYSSESPDATCGFRESSETNGGIISIQICHNYLPLKNELFVMTGNQKLIIKESIHCAFNVIGHIIGVNKMENMMEKYKNGFHIHVMDASTPKDGPSAGCAFAIAFYSLFAEKKINQFVSMTGELGLDGSIHKIGGVHNKIAGAERAGIKVIFVPLQNFSDIGNKFNIVVKPVSHINEIINDKDLFIN